MCLLTQTFMLPRWCTCWLLCLSDFFLSPPTNLHPMCVSFTHLIFTWECKIKKWKNYLLFCLWMWYKNKLVFVFWTFDFILWSEIEHLKKWTKDQIWFWYLIFPICSVSVYFCLQDHRLSYARVISKSGYILLWLQLVFMKNRVAKSRPFQWTPWDLISGNFWTVVNEETTYLPILDKLWHQTQSRCLSI